jgi:hypothetical protein
MVEDVGRHAAAGLVDSGRLSRQALIPENTPVISPLVLKVFPGW